VSDTDDEGDIVARLTDENERLLATLDSLKSRIVELELIADTDTLVPIPNRRAFLRDVERILHQAGRHATSAALLFVDLDGLKRINDVYGHHAGDALLIHVAKLLKASLRGTDQVARIGGDEFGVLLDHLDQASAQAKADALFSEIANSVLEFGGVSLRVAASIGLAMVEPGDSVASLLSRADAAMYAARAQRSER
jgi:diguanylate cyclase (GGDEF)-like protein